MLVRYVTIKQFSTNSGYSEDAIRSKIKRGDWAEGVVWKRAPDGRQLIDVEGYYKWVETQSHRRPASKLSVRPASKSVSHIAASAAASGLSLSPLPLT